MWLQVEKHPDPQCRERWIKIVPGVALDCCGREIYVDDPVYCELPLPVAMKGNAGEYKLVSEPATGTHKRGFLRHFAVSRGHD